MLPDIVLLEVFDFYRGDPTSKTFFSISWSWKTLIRVCRRWRQIVLGSPRRLDLRIVCSETTPVRTSLDIWPPFPICIFSIRVDKKGVRNIISAVERGRDRTSGFYIVNITGPALRKLSAVMHGPFPVLTEIYLKSTDESVPVLPETFGGSAPRLQHVVIEGISFLSFPKIISSATNIIYLDLFDIPRSGYISPEKLATSLATLPNLMTFSIGYRSPLSRPFQISSPPLSRAVLSSLTKLHFRGASEYFEDLLPRIHAPLINWLSVVFFMSPIFNIPRLESLIVEEEELRPLSPAWAVINYDGIKIVLGLPARIQLGILSTHRDRQLSSLAQVCNRHLPVLSLVEQLNITEHRGVSLNWKDDMDPSKWFELFGPFIAIRDLYVSEQLVPFVAAALQVLKGERTMEVLPALKNLFLEGYQPSGSVQGVMKGFVSARELSGNPVVIHSESPLAHPLVNPQDG